MTTRLVSFLGLGPDKGPPHYKSVRYQMDGSTSVETPLLEEALIGLYPEITGVFVLGTKEVKERWFDTGLFAGYLKRPYFLIDPPLATGNTAEELWAIFDAMTAAMTLSAIPKLGEQDTPDSIIVDITHGFRLQPMLGLAALSFVLSEWARQSVEKLPTVRIVYGAFEARNADGVAPIWDLTEFLTANRWNSAIDALMRYGRADEFAQMTRLDAGLAVAAARQAGIEGKELGEAGYAKVIGLEAKRFADDLATSRLKSVLTHSSHRLYEALCDRRADELATRLPPIRLSLERLKQWLEPLRAQSTLTREGLEATGYLAQLLGRLERFSEQAAVLREGLITLHSLNSGQDPLPDPGTGFPSKRREEHEAAWGQDGRLFRDGERDFPEEILKNIELSQSVLDTRNDMQHCGINDHPSSADALRSRLKELSDRFWQLAGAKRRQ